MLHAGNHNPAMYVQVLKLLTVSLPNQTSLYNSMCIVKTK